MCSPLKGSQGDRTGGKEERGGAGSGREMPEAGATWGVHTGRLASGRAVASVAFGVACLEAVSVSFPSPLTRPGLHSVTIHIKKGLCCPG